MADREITSAHGSIEITIDLATAKDGNKALAEARASAAAQAKDERRQITGEYGTRRDGDKLVVIFPLKGE